MSDIPSVAAAKALACGQPGGVMGVITSTALRGGLIAAGLYVAGTQKDKLVKEAIYAAIAIEVFVLG